MPYPKNKYKGKNHWNCGHIPWNKGIPMTDEVKRKVSEACKGTGHTEEWKMKLRKIMTGRKNWWGQKISDSKMGKRTSTKTEFLSGDKHWNWKGGVSQERNERFSLYHKKREKIWSNKIRNRDGWTCQKCESKKYLIAHHIDEWKPNSPNNYLLKNGITLCRKCHIKVHLELLKKWANSVES